MVMTIPEMKKIWTEWVSKSGNEQDGEERKIRHKRVDEDYKRTQRKEISPRNINIGLYGLPRWH